MEILKDLWYGQICPMEDSDCRDPSYRELAELCDRNEAKLLHTLSQTQQEDFQKVKDVWEEMGSAAECTAFITGFRLAVQIMAASVQ